MKNLAILFFLLGSMSVAFAADTIRVDIPNLNVSEGDNFTLDVKVSGFENVVGAQFTVKYDQEVLNYLNVDNFAIASINKNNNFGIPEPQNGTLSFLWYDFLAQGISLEDETTLFSIQFMAVGSDGDYSDVELDTSGAILNVIEFSNSEGAVMPYVINKGKVTIGTVSVHDFNINDLSIGSFSPSVVNNQTTISIESPMNLELKYNIIDLSGKTISSGNSDLLIGQNKLKFEGNELPNVSGTYFIEFQIENQKIARKFIKM